MSESDAPRTKIGDPIRIRKPPNGPFVIGVIKDEVHCRQSDYRDKLFCFQLIEFENGKRELRFGYYLKGLKLGFIGKWVWG